MSEHVHHVGITVEDLDQMVSFYQEAFGFEVLDRFEVSGESFSTGVGVPDATGSFAHLDGDGVRLELVEYDPEGSDATPDAVNQPGSTHVGVGTDDVDGVYEDLPETAEPVSEPQTTASGARILFLRDPEDNLVEVIDP
ncbi:VOC family protein [Halomicrobium salinisoli]|uniref:VOC family protein n=1 Tax=Halomicrobium salinisoli TaxID=2878391 RepID=UPI001CF00CF7|nr:VOC family protein [Halomicrobium salinisoli]